MAASIMGSQVSLPRPDMMGSCDGKLLLIVREIVFLYETRLWRRLSIPVGMHIFALAHRYRCEAFSLSGIQYGHPLEIV